MRDLVGLVEGLDGGRDGGERCDLRAGKELGFELIGEDEVGVLEEAFVSRYFVFGDVESSFVAHYWVQYCHILLVCVSKWKEKRFGYTPEECARLCACTTLEVSSNLADCLYAFRGGNVARDEDGEIVQE